MSADVQIKDANYWREAFLRFFEGKDHKRIAAASLIPENDKTTLFTVAGMQQFKDDLMGNLRHDTVRATSVQKCLRMPDLEEVGKTQRHQTMFEMAGYFSFGDYFKEDAIKWFWEFYTSPEWLGLDKDRIRVTVYEKDDEAYELWKKTYPPLHEKGWIYRLDEDENFWPAGCPSEGPNGVCGPCSEVFWDGGEEYGEDDLIKNDYRFMELGNIVFTQFDRSGPVPGKGTLTPLPKNNIDFGGGFERLVMVAEDVRTTLDTSLFMPIRHKLRELAQDFDDQENLTTYQMGASGIRAMQVGSQRIPFHSGTSKVTDEQDIIREKRIADHVRAAAFCVSDGVTPSSEGAGYVLRRLVRRAYRDGAKLGFREPFLYKLIDTVRESYGKAYPNIETHASMIVETIKREEEDFDRVLSNGLERLESGIASMLEKSEKSMSGEFAFDLHSTFGLPVDVTRDVLEERGLGLDEEGFEKAFDNFREKSRGGFAGDVFKQDWFGELKAKAEATEFTGYDSTELDATIVGLSIEGQLVDSIEGDQDATIVLDKTPFYGESGGQVGDTGYIADGEQQFLVSDTQRTQGYFMHVGRLLSGSLKVGQKVKAEVDGASRDLIRANHSATHLMHSALRDVLGDHVHQKGSLVDSEYLRFDFSQPKKVALDEIEKIETLVNEWISSDYEVQTEVTTPDKAREAGALMFFGDKYGDEVRMLKLGGVSTELCGGTHVGKTNEIGTFRITSESSVASGVRRVEAITGSAATKYAQQDHELVENLSKHLGASMGELEGRIKTLVKEVRQLKSGKGGGGASADSQNSQDDGKSGLQLAQAEHRLVVNLSSSLKVPADKLEERVKSLTKELEDLKSGASSSGGGANADELAAKAEDIAGTKTLIQHVPSANMGTLLELKDKLMDSAEVQAVVLAGDAPGKASVMVGLSESLVGKGLDAGKLIRDIAALVDGRGGGKKHLAQAGGKNPDGIPEALIKARELLQAALA